MSLQNWQQKSPAFLKSQDEMGIEGLPPDKVSATKALNENLEKVKEENGRKLRLERDRLDRRQRERDAALKAKHEKRKGKRRSA